MGVQFTDGSFEGPMPYEDAVEVFNRAVNDGTARALHVGSFEDVEKAKEQVDLQKELKELSNRVQALEYEQNDGLIVKPTRDQIQAILPKETVTWKKNCCTSDAS